MLLVLMVMMGMMVKVGGDDGDLDEGQGRNDMDDHDLGQ